MLPPPNHTPSTQTHTHSHRPGCQSYTNSHPLAAGFQDNHGNQSLTPGETSSRSERLHSISTSQYSTHKRTHMHIFHTLIHTHSHKHEHTGSHWHGHVQNNPLALTASQSLQPSLPPCLPASTGVSGSLLERPHTTSSHPRSSTAHARSSGETLITLQSLWLHMLLQQVDTLFVLGTMVIFLPPLHQNIKRLTARAMKPPCHLTDSTVTTWQVPIHCCYYVTCQQSEICILWSHFLDTSTLSVQHTDVMRKLWSTLRNTTNSVTAHSVKRYF